MNKKQSVSKSKKNKTEANPKRTVTVLVSVFLSVILVFGLTLGAVYAVRVLGSVVTYNGMHMDKGVATYLAVTNKNFFMSKLGFAAQDTPVFWATDATDGKTYGELLSEDTEEYIRFVMLGSYRFDRSRGLTSEERTAIKNAVRSRLEYVADGSVSRFNEMAKPMGFDYNDFMRATEMMYKAECAIEAVYGTNGEALTSPAYSALCDEYYSTFSYVRIVFIRTETEFKVDEDGNRIKGDNGEDETRELSDDEKADRLADIEEMRRAIEAFNTGSDRAMSDIYFNTFLERYSYDYSQDLSGHMLSSLSDYSIELSQYCYDVVKEALAMETESFSEAEYPDGVAFIYRMQNPEGAYTLGSLSEFFEDFYKDCASYQYSKYFASVSDGVVFKEGYYGIDLGFLPKNDILIASIEF